jgi:Cu+-exporting ATPase
MTANIKPISLPVQGMSCASCVAHVERALKELPGVSDVVVNLATNKASLTYDPAQVGLPALTTAVADVGYVVPTDELTLDMQGMTCASCVAQVEGALTELDGVIGAVVNLGLGTARVTYIPGVVTTGAMKQVVHDVGYEATERSAGVDALDRERQARADEIRRQGRNLLIAGAIGMLVMIGTFYQGCARGLPTLGGR